MGIVALVVGVICCSRMRAHPEGNNTVFGNATLSNNVQVIDAPAPRVSSYSNYNVQLQALPA
ncbi:MAG: hypothetical protein V4629_04760 [Pseudomonadota bacterium]